MLKKKHFGHECKSFWHDVNESITYRQLIADLIIKGMTYFVTTVWRS
jgi:hypothetical protein